MKYRFLLVVFMTLSCLGVFASNNLEGIIRNMQNQAVLGATQESSKINIPHYSEQAKEQENIRLNSIDEKNLNAEGQRAQVIAESDKDNFAGIASKASKKELLPNFDKLLMFKKADDIFGDPISALNELSDESCREHLSKENHSIGKKDITETKQDIIYEKVQCEQPNNIFKCEKELHLTCSDTQTCNSGGILPGTIGSGMEWKYEFPILKMGTVGEFYFYNGDSCEKAIKVGEFEIKGKEAIAEFGFVKLFFNDHLRVLVNGVQVFNSFGGDKLDIAPNQRLNQDSWIDAGSGKGGVCNTRGRRGNHTEHIDIRQYLKEGKNQISLELVFGYQGHLYLEMVTKQHCCMSWKEEWRQRCWSN